MPDEAAATISPPVLVYIGMGVVTARILLDRTKLRGLGWLDWLRFLVKAGSIVLLWPLVLFIENLQEWLRPSHEQKRPGKKGGEER